MKMLFLVFLAVLAAPVAALLAGLPVSNRIQLAFSGSTGMVVSWITGEKLDKPTVKYGLSEDKMVFSASSTESTMSGSSSLYANRVEIVGLQPDTLYYYHLHARLDSDSLPEPHTFKTAKPAGDMGPYSIAFLSNSSISGTALVSSEVPHRIATVSGQRNVLDSLQSRSGSYDFVIYPGGGKYEDEMEEIPPSCPWLTSSSGLEGSNQDDTMLNRWIRLLGLMSPYRTVLELPTGSTSSWYSFDYGSVHYVFMDPTSAPHLSHPLVLFSRVSKFPGSRSLVRRQFLWLQRDLKSVDRCKTPWVVAVYHNPNLVSHAKRDGMSPSFAMLLSYYDVDLVLQDRLQAVQYDDQRGSGVLLHGPGMLLLGNDRSRPISTWHSISGNYGWSRIHFHNQTHLEHDFVPGDSDGAIHKTVLLRAHNNVCQNFATVSDFERGPSEALPPMRDLRRVKRLATSIVQTTAIITVTQCPVTVTNCPIESIAVVTSTVDLFTTVCPATEPRAALTSLPNPALSPAVSSTYTDGSSMSSSTPSSCSYEEPSSGATVTPPTDWFSYTPTLPDTPASSAPLDPPPTTVDPPSASSWTLTPGNFPSYGVIHITMSPPSPSNASLTIPPINPTDIPATPVKAKAVSNTTIVSPVSLFFITIVIIALA